MYSWTGPSRPRGGVGKALLMASTAIALVAVNGASARAQNAQQLQNKIDQLEQELQSMKGQLQGGVQQQKRQ